VAPVVWVVDDDRGVRAALSRLLRGAAFQVTAMRSAREFLDALVHSVPDCLLLEKPVEAGPLLDAVIRAVARGRAWREARTMREEATSRLATLTPREREVFSLVALGKPNKQIASELGTTEKTIKVHRGRVMSKLGADSVVDLVRLAQTVDQLAG